MKQRFAPLDVRCCATELRQRCVGMRLVNVYDVNARTYILKFARNEEKVFVLVESGTRMHTTEFFRDKNNIPSGFAMKLRKHIRTRRLMDVRQLGYDRIVQFDFTGAEGGFYLFVEFYAAGNIILTDHQYSIMSLLRVVQPNEETRFAVRETYDVAQATEAPAPIAHARLRDLLQRADAGDALKKSLTALEYGAVMTEHAILTAGLKPGDKTASLPLDGEAFAALVTAFVAMDALIAAATTTVQSGYIFAHEAARPAAAAAVVVEGAPADATASLIFEEFWAFVPAQFAAKQCLPQKSFDKAVDEFFSRMESQKIELKTAQQEAQAIKKIAFMRDEHEKRVEQLSEAQFTNVEKAQLIEANLQRVDEAIMVVRSMLAQGTPWKEMKELVKEEKAKGNPVALVIDRLKLETNQITLSLSEPAEPDYDDSDESDSERPEPQPPRKHVVDVNLDLSAFANARAYYNLKRANATKQERTIAASEKAMKNAERKIMHEVQHVKVTSTITRLRKPFWFEKFLWFISSENFVVVAGRDMQQNELLVKRYMRKGDLYVHADIHGASSVIIKNPTGAPVPPSTLAQAGAMAVCQSSAWDSKVVLGAYWVEHHQVSKTAPTGEYLTTGSFMIRGKKNFLPPVQLVLGFGLLFKVDEASVANHLNERRPRGEVTESEQDAASSKYDVESVAESAGPAAAGGGGGDDDGEDVEIKDAGSDGGHGGDDDDDAALEAAEQAAERNVREMQAQAERDEAARNAELFAPAAPAAADEDASDSDEDDGEPADTEPAEAEPAEAEPAETRPAEVEAAFEYPDTDVMPAVLATIKAKPLAAVPSAAPAKRPTVAPPAPKSKPQQQQQAPRGKRGKLKKMKDKYGEQDDEDRELAMKILAPAKKAPPPPPPSKKSAPPRMQRGQKKPPKGKVPAADAGDAGGEGADDDAELEKKLNDETLAKAEREELRRIMAEEKITLLEEEELSQLSEIDALTGMPLAHDVLLFAIPVCAPYSALNGYKYRIKLTPGTQRKGKAAKMAVAQFVHTAEITQREKDLVKAVPETEMIQQMKAAVKLSAPNLEKTKSQAKKRK